MAATLHRLADVFDPVESSFTDEQRRAIMESARRAIAKRPPRAAPLPKLESSLERWKREGAEIVAAERAAAAELKREQREQQRQQRRQREWSDYINEQIRSAVLQERAQNELVLAELLGELLARIEKLERAQMTLDRLTEARMEVRLAELKTLAARTTVAVGEITDLIHEGRSGLRQSLARALRRRGLRALQPRRKKPL